MWNGPSIGQLQALEVFSTGGWWHDVNILAATGQGEVEEEKRGWEGWWNESIAELVQLSMQQKDTLTVLLTGRKESAFSDLISRMVKSRGLEFDMVCLKPAVGPANQKIGNTMTFKQELLKDVVDTYSKAEELKIYEDRPKHTAAFRSFFSTMNRNLQASQDPDTRPPFAYDVVQVNEQAVSLDPQKEVEEVQRMINSHNEAILNGSTHSNSKMANVPLAIKKTVFYTGYLIAPQDTERLLPLANLPHGSNNDLRHLANNILITPRPAPVSIMQKVGGLGARVRFRVTHIAVLENKLWAVRVAPTDPTVQVHTENPVPLVVLALKRNAKTVDATRIRQNMWQPVSAQQMIEFETVVGEKALLRIEEERWGEEAWESQFPTQRNASTHAPTNAGNASFSMRDDDFPTLGSSQQTAPGSAQRPQERPQGRRYDRNDYPHDRSGAGVQKNSQRGGRGGKNFGRGRGGRGGGRGGQGRRGGQYRSLDDSVGNNTYGGGGMQY